MLTTIKKFQPYPLRTTNLTRGAHAETTFRAKLSRFQCGNRLHIFTVDKADSSAFFDIKSSRVVYARSLT